MKNLPLIFLGTFWMFAIASCYYDKEETLYPLGSSSCDSAGTISYAQKVVPIFQQQCYSCHSGGAPSGGIAMGTYNADKVIALNGKLYGSISHASGFSPMPQGGAKMSDCNLAIIKKWIDANCPNN
jgi:hypothetical protein